MTDPRYDRLQALFMEAVALSAPARRRLLDRVSLEDQDLRVELDALLESDARANGPVDGDGAAILAAQLTDTTGANDDASCPAEIGGYRILRRLGAGGMGVVYEAEQAEPKRTVAIKVIRDGMVSEGALRRFRHEAQILGRLRHPGIARIYAAGTDHGTPWIAMELVEGTPLLEAAHGLERDDRVRLLALICDAVHDAHQHGVVHRDLKPANILVEESGTASDDEIGSRGTSTGGAALGLRPRVLDFGVARVIDPDLVQATIQTAPGELVGTVAYMSPEQAGGDPEAIDTRSDVYALGVIGYELLTGALPHEVRDRPLYDALHSIREEDPTLPSTHARGLRGELDTILLKTLERDPSRRYQSASELAADLRRYLTNQPITARPPTSLYQLRKFTARNRALVTAAVVIMVAMAVATAWSLVAASAARAAREASELEATKTREINRFLLRDLLNAASPEIARGEPLDVRDALRRAIERIDGAFPDMPDVEASVRHSIGNTLRQMGEYEEAESQLRRAYEMRRTLYGLDHGDTLASLNKLSTTLHKQLRLEEAIELAELCAEADARLYGPRHNNTMTALNNLGTLYLSMDRYDDAIRTHRHVLEWRLQEFGATHSETMDSMYNLGSALLHIGEYAEAERLIRRVTEGDEANHGVDHPLSIQSRGQLAIVLRQCGRDEEAEVEYRVALDRGRRVLGDQHLQNTYTMVGLAKCLIDQGDLDEAEALAREALALRRAQLDPGTREFAVAECVLGCSLLARGSTSEAEPLLTAAYTTLLEVGGPDHTNTVDARTALAELYRRTDREDEADALEGMAGTTVTPAT